MPFTVPYSMSTVSSTTVEAVRTVVLTKPAPSANSEAPLARGPPSSSPSSVEGKLSNGSASNPGAPGTGFDGSASQNSPVAAPSEVGKAAQEAPAKDVEKERHYNAFMEARLKLGQTKTVAEPLKKLKAVQQQQTDVKVLRRGSAPVFSQAMLKRPSERRQSMVKAVVANSDGTKIENGNCATSRVNGVQEVTPPGRPSSKSPPDTRGSQRTSPVKNRPSSTFGGSTMSGTATTVVVTLADVAKKEAAEPVPKPKRVTTLRLTKKPSLETPDRNGQVEAPKSEGKANGTVKEPEPTTGDGKRVLAPKRATAGPVPVRRRPSKTATTGETTSSNEASTPTTNDKVHVNGIHEPKSAESSATPHVVPNPQVSSTETSSDSVVQEVKTLESTTREMKYPEVIPKEPVSRSETLEELKPSKLDDEELKSSERSTAEMMSSAVGASERSVQELKASVTVSQESSEGAVQKLKPSESSPQSGVASQSTSEGLKSEGASKTTMIRSATFAVESSGSVVRKTTATTRASGTKTQMQKVDIKDLRSLLRTPSPQPPKEDDSEIAVEKRSHVFETKATKTRDEVGLPRGPSKSVGGEETSKSSLYGKSKSLASSRPDTERATGAVPKDLRMNGHLGVNGSEQYKSEMTSKTPPKPEQKVSPEDRTYESPARQSRFLKATRADFLNKRPYRTFDTRTSITDDLDDASPPGSISEASTSGVSSMSSTRRESGTSLRRPSTLSWDSDAFSTATPSPCEAATHRSRSISVESADLDELHYKTPTPTRCLSAYRPHSAYSARWTRGLQSSNLGSSSSPQVGELWSDLTQEQAASAQAAEMLDAESADRMRLEKEVRELQSRCSQLQQQKDRIEMEVSESRMLRSINAELNGDLSDEEDINGVSVYKQKYERALRDAEMKKRQMSQQHEDDVEKQVMSRKAAEKKLAEALDDVEEGRQAVNQWKRKAQKLSAELQDLQLIVEEHMSRNAELERKQRKFDGELSAAVEGLKQERCSKEKILREKEALYAEKLALEQELESVRLELEMQHTKLTSLHKELDELTFSSHGEEEVAKLKRAKQEVERKARDQEEELEDLASQVQLLEQSKLRLEMALEKQRQEHRREVSNKEEELDEARAAAAKKLRNLEALLESEQEERHALARQKNDLERRLAELGERPPPRDPEIERRLRRDLKRTRALLRDAQGMLEHAHDRQATRTLVRQLKNQLEDAEFAKTAAVKARQGAEMELQEVQSQLEDVLRAKNESEGRCLQLSREKGALQIQLEEIEEEQAELMKKYKAAMQQMASDQKVISEQSEQILELESEKHHLREQVQDLSSKVEHMSCQAEESHMVRRLETRVRDLESKLELEQTSKSRLEGQVQRLKDQCNRLQEECHQAGAKEQQTQENCRKLQRQLRDLREDCTALQHREAEAQQRCHELEMALDNAETDLQGTRNDLKLACQRIQDLQAALEEDLDSGTDILDDSESDEDEDDVDVDSLLRKHGLSPTGAKPSGYSHIREGSPVASRRSSSSAAFSLSRSNESHVSGLSSVSPEAVECPSDGRQVYTDEQLVNV